MRLPVGRVAVAGALAQRPGQSGHAWVFLQYLRGFRRLGWDVLFVDRVVEGDPPAAVQKAWLDGVMRDFGFGDAYVLLEGPEGPDSPPGRRARRFLESADLLLDFMGYLDEPAWLGLPGTSVFVDLDPGLDQIWCASGLADLYGAHDRFVTVGLNVGRPDCRVPTCGRSWIPTVPPVALEEWVWTPPPPARVTTVATWRGDAGRVSWNGEDYGQRVHQFRRFMSLPGSFDETVRFEPALAIHAEERDDRRALAEGRWTVLDPAEVAGTPRAYRSFIRQSTAELCIASDLYVRTRGGWFSDRSACYLASGRAVVAQDTGFSRVLPTGSGLRPFVDPDGAKAAIDAVLSDPAREGRAARELAREVFAADRALPRLLDAVFDGSVRSGSPAAVST